MRAAVITLLCVWFVAGPVWAKQAPIPPFRTPAGPTAATPPFRGPESTPAEVTPAPAKAAEVPAGPSAAAPAVQDREAPKANLDFDAFGDSDKPKPDAAQAQAQLQKSLKIERQSKRRRNMLLAHQTLGFATLAGLLATCVVGQLNYYDKYQSGDFTGRYQDAHLYLSATTSVLFTTTGLLALLAPNPYPKPLKFDTVMVHRVAMAMATAGMVTQIILGSLTATTQVGKLDQPTLALAHVVTGYATLGFMTVGTLSLLF